MNKKIFLKSNLLYGNHLSLALYNVASFVFLDYQSNSTKSVKWQRILSDRNDLNIINPIIQNNTINNIGFSMIVCPTIFFNNHADTIKLSSFAIGKTEVTQGLYQYIMGTNPSYHKNKVQSFIGTIDYGLDLERPVENISWYEAILFCNKLSKLSNLQPYYEITDLLGNEIDNIPRDRLFQTKGSDKLVLHTQANQNANGYRLPQANEWLYAKNAGNSHKWAGTSDDKELKNIAWYNDNSNMRPHRVAEKKPNEWGIYDLNGNVLEWTGTKMKMALGETNYEIAGDISFDQGLNSYGQIKFKHPIYYEKNLGFRLARSIFPDELLKD
jgi:hypothetical protein